MSDPEIVEICPACGFDFSKETLYFGQLGRAQVITVENGIVTTACADCVEPAPSYVLFPYLSLPPG